jgi:hypothetical protein
MEDREQSLHDRRVRERDGDRRTEAVIAQEVGEREGPKRVGG